MYTFMSIRGGINIINMAECFVTISSQHTDPIPSSTTINIDNYGISQILTALMISHSYKIILNLHGLAISSR